MPRAARDAPSPPVDLVAHAKRRAQHVVGTTLERRRDEAREGIVRARRGERPDGDRARRPVDPRGQREAGERPRVWGRGPIAVEQLKSQAGGR